jgi:hypothetical protein
MLLFVDVRDARSTISRHVGTREKRSYDRLNIVAENPSVLDIVEYVRSANPEVEVRFTEQDVRTHYSFSSSGERAKEEELEIDYSVEDSVVDLHRRFEGFRQAAKVDFA